MIIKSALNDTLRSLKLSGMLDTLDTAWPRPAPGKLGHLVFLQVETGGT